MAAQGRGPDRILVHMSPKEVQGLQAIAMAHGGSLTINPETGLPEAGILDNLLPAIAGFALDAFLPGAGEAVGGLFGLEGAAASQLGSALTVGGISGLASGSLEKGIMAGMGAYGGAGLANSMIGSGGGSLASAAESASGPVNATKLAAATEPVETIDRLGALKAGAGSAFSSPKDFLKDNKMNLALLAAPVLMDTFGNKNNANPEAAPSPGYIRTMKRDPVTGQIYQESATPTAEWGNRSVGTYGGVPARGMADGGSVDEIAPMAPTDMIATENNAPPVVSDSQRAMDYLMGKPGATNPMLFTQKTKTGVSMPSDYSTRKGGHYLLDALTNSYVWVPDADSGLSALDKANQERLAATNRGGGRGEGTQTGDGYSAPVSPLSSPMSGGLMYGLVDAYGNALGGMLPGGFIAQAIAQGMNPQAVADASAKSAAAQQAALNGYTSGTMFGANNTGAASTFGGAGYGTPIGAGGYGVTGQTGAGSIANPMGIDPATAQGQQAAGTVSAQDAANQAMTDAANAQATADAVAAGGDSVTGGQDSEGHDPGNPGDAKGGFYKNGKFNFHPAQVYADGGIAALAGGGLGNLGGYSDGGQLLKGPGDGVSDDIPARIAGNQPARLANNEFVIPARIVSELGNGSTDAGARELYKMMDRIQAGRKKSIGKGKIAVDSKAVKHLPA